MLYFQHLSEEELDFNDFWKTSKLGKEYQLKIIRQDKARIVNFDTLDQFSSLIMQDWVIWFLPQEYKEHDSQNVQNTGFIVVFTMKAFYRRVAVKSLSLVILVEKSRVVMIFSEKDRPWSCQTVTWFNKRNKQKRYLDEKFNFGELTGDKMHPTLASRDLRYWSASKKDGTR